MLEGKVREAEMFVTRALKINETAYEDDHISHIEVVKSLKLLSTLHSKQGQPHKATPLLRRCVEIQESLFGSDHPDTVETQKWLVKCTANIEDSYLFDSTLESAGIA